MLTRDERVVEMFCLPRPGMGVTTVRKQGKQEPDKSKPDPKRKKPAKPKADKSVPKGTDPVAHVLETIDSLFPVEQQVPA